MSTSAKRKKGQAIKGRLDWISIYCSSSNSAICFLIHSICNDYWL